MKEQDMSEYLRTRRLLSSACILANENTAVYVNTVKPSVRAVFAYGKYGRLHNLCYAPDRCALYGGKYGIYPLCTINGEECVPFSTSGDCFPNKNDDFRAVDQKNVYFDKDNNTVSFIDVPLYHKAEQRGVLPEFAVKITEDKLELRVTFPENTEGARIALPWYPLFNRYTADGETKYIEYYANGYGRDYFAGGGFCRMADAITLTDSYSRQAGVKIKVKGGKLELRSKTLTEMNNALYLSTDVVVERQTVEVEIEIIRQKTVINGEFYYTAGQNAEIAVNGEAYAFTADAQRGVHTLVMGEGEDTVMFSYCSVPEPETMLKKAGDAVGKLLWKGGKMEGIPTYAFDPTSLVPHLRSGFVYCSHASRIYPILAATSLLTNDAEYVKTGLSSIESLMNISYHGEDGSIFTALNLDEKGNAGERANASRPSDSGIVIRALRYLADACLKFGMEKESEKCIRYAWANVLTLKKMQCEDGDFYERYIYPTAEPCSAPSSRGTVNNWVLQLWKLLPYLERYGMTEEKEITYGIIERYINSQLEKENSILLISGGGEDVADFGDACNTNATLFTIKYLMTGDEKWKQYAEEALIKSWALSCMYADMPEFFCMYGNSDLGLYYDQPFGMYSFGGMHDLTAIEANLFAYEALGLPVAHDIAVNMFKCRISGFINDNGGMQMIVMKCPNYEHRDMYRSETLAYGGVGVFGYALATGVIEWEN